MNNEFLGVHYSVSAAFTQRPVNGRSPNSSYVASLALASEERALETEQQWYTQFVTDWCQGNDFCHRLVERKPAVTPWRAWYLRCLHLEASEGDSLLRRWRQWLREMGWGEMTAVQRLAFDGSYHVMAPMIKEAAEQGRDNPFLADPTNVLVYAVLSRSVETLTLLLQNGFGTPAELRRGESWTGFTALHVALFVQNREMVALLWNQYRANVNARDLFFGSVREYCVVLGLLTNAEVHFRGGPRSRGYGYGFQSLEHVCQLALRFPRSWDDSERHLYELRNVQDVDVVHVPYWNHQTSEMQRMSLAEWADVVRCEYQPFVSAQDGWLDELMFNGVYVRDPTPDLRRRHAALLTNAPKFATPSHLVVSYVNALVGFACYTKHDVRRGDALLSVGGRLHSNRPRWRDVEKTTEMRLNFMRQIHDLGDAGRGIIKKQEVPRYRRDPNFNLAVPGTSFFLNSTECGNLSRLINHSASSPNVELQVVWNAGVPQALVVAKVDIAHGQQLLMDYGQMWHYFDECKERRAPAASIQNFNEEAMFMLRDEREFFHPGRDAVEMSNVNEFPGRISQV